MVLAVCWLTNSVQGMFMTMGDSSGLGRLNNPNLVQSRTLVCNRFFNQKNDSIKSSKASNFDE
jgi:hypothetical protein